MSRDQRRKGESDLRGIMMASHGDGRSHQPPAELELDIGRPGTQVDLAALASLRSLTAFASQKLLPIKSRACVGFTVARVQRLKLEERCSAA